MRTSHSKVRSRSHSGTHRDVRVIDDARRTYCFQTQAVSTSRCIRAADQPLRVAPWVGIKAARCKLETYFPSSLQTWTTQARYAMRPR